MSLEAMIIHVKYDTAYDLHDKNVYLNGQRKLRKSAQGWDLEV